MELTLKMHETKTTIETEYDDITIDEMFNHFNALLISATFTQTQINNYILEKAMEIKEESIENAQFED